MISVEISGRICESRGLAMPNTNRRAKVHMLKHMIKVQWLCGAVAMGISASSCNADMPILHLAAYLRTNQRIAGIKRDQ